MTTPHTSASIERSLLGRLLAQGDEGHRRANEHIARLYTEPLLDYLTRSSFRRLGDADSLVATFLNERLELRRWQASGQQLRRWVLATFRHELLAATRRQSRLRRLFRVQERHEHSAELEYDRAVALAMAREALRMAADDCRARDLDGHWELFCAHHLDGVMLDVLSNSTGLSVHTVRCWSRMAAMRLRRHVRAVVAWPRASDDAVDQELRDLMDALQTRT